MYRSLTDPAYVKASNKHGKRINPRRGSIPTHIMAAYALCRLPGHEGNLREISQEIEVPPPHPPQTQPSAPEAMQAPLTQLQALQLLSPWSEPFSCCVSVVSHIFSCCLNALQPQPPIMGSRMTC